MDAARQYGLVTGGPGVAIERCRQVLAAGSARGFEPAPDAVRPPVVMSPLIGRPSIIPSDLTAPPMENRYGQKVPLPNAITLEAA